MRSRRVIVTLELDTPVPLPILRLLDWGIRTKEGTYWPYVEQVSVNVVKPRKPKPGRTGPSHD